MQSLKDLKFKSDLNSSIIRTNCQSDYDIVKSKPKLWTVSYFYLPKISKKNIEAIHKEALNILKKRKDVIDKLPYMN